MVHVLVNARRFEDTLSIMRTLMEKKGTSTMELMEALVNSFEISNSSLVVLDTLVRLCTPIRATEDIYIVIKKLRMKEYLISIHHWNNFLNHLLKLNKCRRFWEMYKEMHSIGYVENLYTCNLVIHALCKECKLRESITVFYRMLKTRISPTVVTFNMLINGSCKMEDMDLLSSL